MAALSLAVFASRSCLDNPFMHFLCQLLGLRARIVILIALMALVCFEVSASCKAFINRLLAQPMLLHRHIISCPTSGASTEREAMITTAVLTGTQPGVTSTILQL